MGAPERDKTDRSLEPNDGLGKRPFSLQPIILKYNGISLINGSYGFCQNRFVPR